MNDDAVADLKQFIAATVRQEVAGVRPLVVRTTAANEPTLTRIYA